MWICTFPVKYSWFMSKASLLFLMLTYIITTSTLVAGVKCQLIHTSLAVSRRVMYVKGLILRGEVTRISICTSALLNTKLWRFAELQYAQNGMSSLGPYINCLCFSFSRQVTEFSLYIKYLLFYNRWHFVSLHMRILVCSILIRKKVTLLHVTWYKRSQDTNRVKKSLIH